MKKNGKPRVIAQIAGPGLVLAALLALALSGASIGRAQAGTTSPVVTPTKSAEAPAKKPARPAEQSPTKGQHEGIKVHGHWTIEVRNPDGTLVSHTEFENALVQPGGAGTLTGFLLGMDVPGGYEVVLTNGGASTGPCHPFSNGNSASCYLVGSIISPEPAEFADGSTLCGQANPITPNGPCYPLSVASMADGAGLSFTGTAVAYFTTPITDVYLDPILCSGSSATTQGGATISPNSCAQGYNSQATTLTHATLPTPVTIAASGQLIFVNVQISFQ
jgi:hypothetical protein